MDGHSAKTFSLGNKKACSPVGYLYGKAWGLCRKTMFQHIIIILLLLLNGTTAHIRPWHLQ
jgi:hypothetical protein